MTRTHPGFWKVPAVSLVLVAVVLAMCLTASAEAASADHHSCAALTSEGVGLSKILSPSLWAVPVQLGIPLVGVWPLLNGAVEDFTPRAPLVALWGDLSPRSPPA